MTNPTHADNIPGRGRWYTHPTTGEQWPSVTNILDVAVAKHALVPWAAKVTCGKAWDLLPQMVAASRDADKRTQLDKAIKGEVKVVRDTAADLGTRIHAMVEAHAKAQPIPDDEEALPFARQALRFFADFGVDLERDVAAAEATVINRSAGYAGTGDLWVWLTIGGQRRLILVDYKSSSTRPVGSVYVENGLQLAALAKGETLLLDNGDEEECPGPITGTAVLNLRATSYALIPMPFDTDIEAAYTAFQGALATALYIHGRYGEKPQPLPAPEPTTKGKAA